MHFNISVVFSFQLTTIMDISNHQFLSLYHSDFQHTTKQSITKRSFLLQYINGDIFYPINLWPMKLQSIFWNKPIGDKETFELFCFLLETEAHRTFNRMDPDLTSLGR